VYSSPYIIRVIKLRGMRWMGYVVSMGGGEMRNAYKILVDPKLIYIMNMFL
jgi:hypothetical protein